MKKAIRYELSVMFHKKEFIIALCIVMVFCLVSFMYTGNIMANSLFSVDRSSTISADDVFIGSYGAPFWRYFSYVFAFMVVLPYSMSYINDSETGVLPSILTRFSKRKYFLAKIIACFVGNVLIILLPFIINYVLCHIAYPQPWNYSFASYGTRTMAQSILGTDIYINTKYTVMPFYKLFLFSPTLYSIMHILLFSVFSGLLGVLMLSMSFLIKQHRSILFLPVYLIIIGGNVLDSYLYNQALNGFGSYVNTQLLQYLSVFGMYGQNMRLLLGFAVFLIVFTIAAYLYIIKSDVLITGGGVRRGKAGKKHDS